MSTSIFNDPNSLKKQIFEIFSSHQNFIDFFHDNTVFSSVIALLCSLASWLIAKKIILSFIIKVANKTKNEWDDVLLSKKVFDRLACIVPAVVLILFSPLLPLKVIITRFCLSYMILIGTLVIDGILNSFVEIYRNYPVSKRVPVKGYVQIVKMFLFVFSTILIISSLLDKSPWIFLSSIGALTAVLLIVFKNSILSLVANIQIAANQLILVGDWLEMPKFGADGDVLEITLNTIKVQNWDKTYTIIPTHAMLENSYKNWRGMAEAGGRRIKRSLNIDMNSVKFCDDDMLEKFKKFGILNQYMSDKIDEIDTHNKSIVQDLDEKVNGRRLTNLGSYRAYMKSYLASHPKVHDDMTFLVRQLAPGDNGLPLEIYIFLNDIAWVNYEDIQADIFDHLIAVLPEFGLQIFQNPTGGDLKGLASNSH